MKSLRLMMHWLVLGVLLAACAGTDGSGTATTASDDGLPIFGARLAPQLIVGSDGTTIVDSKVFFDKHFGVTCSIAPIPSSPPVTYHCVPDHVASKGWYFSDPGCMSRVFVYLGCGELPKFGHWQEDTNQNACGDFTVPGRWFQLGEPIPGAATVYSDIGDGTCIEMPPIAPGELVLPVTSEITQGSFVTISYVQGS